MIFTVNIQHLKYMYNIFTLCALIVDRKKIYILHLIEKKLNNKSNTGPS